MNDAEHVISYWYEKEIYNNTVVDAFVIILNTVGCIFRENKKCTMCGYVNDVSKTPINKEDLIKQIRNVIKHYKGEKIVKIYTSGSFLDEHEIPADIRSWIISNFHNAKKIIIESRPEFITEKNILPLLEPEQKIYIAIGLESSSDYIRRVFINKSFSFKQFCIKADLIHKLGGYVKTYLILKPPFLSEYDAIADTIKSVLDSFKYSDEISINPVNIQKNTIVEELFHHLRYRSPWLWSVVEVIKTTHSFVNIPIISSPTGGGSLRGAHNCFNCDKTVLNAIDKFSLHQDISIFDDIDCSCRPVWQVDKNISKFNLTSGYWSYQHH
ncbi:MAG: archaeosine biosynthesis radical SAM protein RaSEA [Candidatus Thermoplasmatota archaeon]|nr:archaeosine biosynthesis radical SAM protein RaSEA [Candidatus Thermoplasmatota archaeon]MCL5963572.1 archaeosine biosynthesis radical SAM protein RaSEA [Candidatus Thermoplasmatota archaeon]